MLSAVTWRPPFIRLLLCPPSRCPSAGPSGRAGRRPGRRPGRAPRGLRWTTLTRRIGRRPLRQWAPGSSRRKASEPKLRNRTEISGFRQYLHEKKQAYYIDSRPKFSARKYLIKSLSSNQMKHIWDRDGIRLVQNLPCLLFPGLTVASFIFLSLRLLFSGRRTGLFFAYFFFFKCDVYFQLLVLWSFRTK